MQIIYKYGLIHGENMIPLPSDSLPLSVHAQGNIIMMWVLHQRDPSNARLFARTFVVVNTGEPFDIGHASFIGTALLMDGAYIKHVFEQL